MEVNNICSSAIVAQVLSGKDNYENWRACIKYYFLVRDLWDVVEQAPEPLKQGKGYGADFKAWRKRNLTALHAIQISCDPSMLSYIRNMTTAKDAWKTLAQRCAVAVARDADRTHILELLKGIKEHDLESTKSVLTSHTHLANAVIGDSSFTAFHFAIFKGQLDMIDEFLSTMSEEHLKKQDRYGRTVLHHAAKSENTKIAQSLIRKNRELLTFPDNGGDIPLNYAYFALDLLRHRPHLAFVERGDGINAVTVLSCQPSAFLAAVGIKQIYDLKVTHVYAHELLLLMSKTIAVFDAAQCYRSSVHQAMLNAAQWGMTEFIVEVIKPNLDLLMVLDEERRDIFQIAVAHRQEKVFGLIYGLDATKYLFLPYTDRNSNNMLHLVGQLSPSLRLSFNKSQVQLCKCKENYNGSRSASLSLL
ncbi:Ankyrin repeat family protein, putative [Theobroma cacao]|uniref:Ankyrin repeat family protein, putative n=1 Tax=Theobroma cacao TaxID=3641 RepID=A0A061FTR4_THECC|nr:Ankyrin repeat family protein, putative [Theobroma cacao]